MSQNGKGDSPRKKGVSWKVWDKNYEKIFGKRKQKIQVGLLTSR
jgi:hypothetical protein